MMKNAYLPSFFIIITSFIIWRSAWCIQPRKDPLSPPMDVLKADKGITTEDYEEHEVSLSPYRT